MSDATLTPERVVELTADALIAHIADGHADPAESTVQTLIENGAHPDFAHLAVDTLPSAMMLPILEEHGAIAPREFERRLTDGRSVRISRVEDPVWGAATWFVSEILREGDYRRYLPIAELSAEWEALSQIIELEGKDEACGATIASTPRYALPPDSPLLPDRVRQKRSWLARLLG
ncbi:MAG: hypothetical protein AAGC57_09020 [Pseudomonadota bacterium]